MAKRKRVPNIDLMKVDKRGELSDQQRRGLAEAISSGDITAEEALSLKATGELPERFPDRGRVISSPKDLGRISGKPTQPTEFTKPKGLSIDFSGSDFWSDKWDFKKNKGEPDPDFQKTLKELGPNPRFFEAPRNRKGRK